jgi:DNA invertase Pin-like site-specific DNA recombinase
MSAASIPAPAAADAVVLYRISDDKQDSIPTQRAWSERVAQRDALGVVGEFEEEGVSGASVKRPGLEDLAAFVRQRFFAREPVRYLLVIDLDRLGRRDSFSTSAWLESLRTHGLRYIVTTAQRFDLHSALDRTLINLSSDFTREPELRAKSNHVLNGMAERARKGLWMGGAPPFGYRIGDDGHLTPGPDEEVEMLRWIFRTYASGRLTGQGVARALNERGVKAPRAKGGRWCRRSILNLLRNRAYLGCTAWGGQQVGRYHRLDKGLVVPREDKADREQQQLLRGLKHLPVRLADDDADLIFCPNAHPALVDPETFQACEAQRAKNKDDYSAPREYKVDEQGKRDKRGKAGRKGDVWPLAGQMKCGHCGEPIWVMPYAPSKGGSATARARLACSRRRADGPGACPCSGQVRYADALSRVVNLVRRKLGAPGAAAEMAREVERQLAERREGARRDRRPLERRVADLDGQIADATRALMKFPDDLKAGAFEVLRGLKAERDGAARELRDLDAAEREAAAIDPDDFRATLEAAAGLSATWETREEAELLRATLRDLVQEVRLFWRPRTPADKLPPELSATKRLLRRVEVDLTPAFVELLTTGSLTSSATTKSPTMPTP